MEQIDRIVAIAALLGCLLLVTSGSRFRAMSGAKWLKLAAIWVVIFMVVALLVRAGGLLVGP